MADLFDLYRELRAVKSGFRAASSVPLAASLVSRNQAELATGNWQLTTDLGGVA
jgi:hypothetical protein